MIQIKQCSTHSCKQPLILSRLKLLLFSVLILIGSRAVLADGRASLEPGGSAELIKLNQIGYHPDARKVAIVPADGTEVFRLINSKDGTRVYEGKLTSPKLWAHSGETVRQAEFSEFATPGIYILELPETALSHPFTIHSTALLNVHKAALKSYYLNRSGMEIAAQYGGEFARAAGHPDNSVKVHKSAASKSRPAGTKVSAPGGWYDAGDYGKYTVNSGISTYTLLLAYLHFEDFYNEMNTGIPESGDKVPDILDEAKWNLDWMQRMQDEDGGVYHKLTALRFSAIDTTPEKHTAQRYMIGKSVTAALDFAAVMAVASRVFKDFDAEFPGLADQYRQQAEKAFQWAMDNPDALYQQPRDVKTGAYGDKNAADEFAWAAAELYLLTKKAAYLEVFTNSNIDAGANLSWPTVDALSFISLSSFGKDLLSPESYQKVQSDLLEAANELHQIYADSAYGVSADQPDFVWGSNSDILNNGLVLVQAFRLTGEQRYLNAAMSTVNYVLGTNATGYSFVTGHGDKTPMNIHHRPSVADKVKAPVPGFLAGGPHSGRQDKCDYPSEQPAMNYADTVCSYSTNEIAINWNAPLVYMLAAAINLH